MNNQIIFTILSFYIKKLYNSFVVLKLMPKFATSTQFYNLLFRVMKKKSVIMDISIHPWRLLATLACCYPSTVTPLSGSVRLVVTTSAMPEPFSLLCDKFLHENLTLGANFLTTQQTKCKHFFAFAARKFGSLRKSHYICSRYVEKFTTK